MIFIDTETTGLNPNTAEILELCIMDNSGIILYHERFRPERAEAWPEAEAVNHISPADVRYCIPFQQSEDAAEAIRDYLTGGAVVAGWNVKFDLDMLRANGAEIPTVQIEDVMHLYADLYGEIMPDGRKKWSKLTDAAAAIGYKLPKDFTAHSAAGDCMLTRAVYRHVMTFWNAIYNDGLRAAVVEAREAMKEVQASLHRIHEAMAARTVIEADDKAHIDKMEGIAMALQFLAPIMEREAENLEEGLKNGTSDS